MKLILGIDDAGRGPVIGPMMLAGVLVTPDQNKSLKADGAKDSKLLSHPPRIFLAKKIKNNSIAHKVISTSAEEIDESLTSGTNLNTLEAIKTAKIINSLNNKKDQINVIVDCPSINTVAWRATLLELIDYKSNLEISCEHKADFNHPSVSAASILAKVAREDAVTDLKKQHGNFGSGYPSDPRTKSFLKSYGKQLSNSGLFRKTWATWKKAYPSLALEIISKKQKTLF